MTLDDIGKPILAILNFALFIIVSVVFLPALVIVNLLQKWWSDQLGSLFDL